MKMTPVRAAIVMGHPAQQFTRGLQLLSDEQEIELHVYYRSTARSFKDPGFNREVSWDVDLLGGYDWSAPPHSITMPAARARWFIQRLRSDRPEIVICYGWGSTIARECIMYCMLARVPILLYGDSTWQHPTGGRGGLIRAVLLRAVTMLCSGAVSTGTFNREFYIRYGMHPRRIWPGVCPADTEAFEGARTEARNDKAASPHHLSIGFAGKLIPRKGVKDLLEAAALLPRSRDWSVTIVGDGPLLGELQDLVQGLGLVDRVVFRGFANTSEMPKLLASFDVVVVPSHMDMRALVTIEAMAAGATIVVSDATAVWGAGDLVQHGITGLVYPAQRPDALATQLASLLDDPDLLAMLCANGTARVSNFGPEAFARTMKAAIVGYSHLHGLRAGTQGRTSTTTEP